MAEITEFLVVGGGPAGATTALALALAGRSVVLVEKAAFPRRKVCGEFMSAGNGALFERLGLSDLWTAAGPPVERVALFAGETVADAPMPAGPRPWRWGRALGRAELDTALLDAASKAGATVLQPARVTNIEIGDSGRWVSIEQDGENRRIAARTIIAAHGSWERGPVPVEAHRDFHAASDLLAFKAHLDGSRLPPGLMPLISFAGGYGGMVHLPGGLASISLCIRRDRLEAVRLARHGMPAGEAILAELRDNVRGIRESVPAGAVRGAWLAAGPIRPGLRACYADGVFRAGNLAGEAHPVVAEGLSMAMEGGALLASLLLSLPHGPGRSEAEAQAGRAYHAAWRASFAPRIRAAAAISACATRPALAAVAVRIAAALPQAVSATARLAGKSAAPPVVSGPYGH
jgi:flavin-dependent dehydrogenase